MPRVIYNTATTLDGFLADEHDSLDWLFVVERGDGAAEFDVFLEGVGVIVQGSTTYEWVLEHEDLVTHPEKWPGFYGSRPTYVFTTRELPSVPGADVRFVSGTPQKHWDEIMAAAGDRDVWVVGGGDLAGQFADAGLLDELRVSVAPATLGSGRSLLPRVLGADRLRLQSVRQNAQFAELVYAVSRP
ncbi:dihydrofolate reductase family protein [Microbacterium lacus]|uniref:dihydrofolate reductase family protein n=1 Tax=Microbacterium lacus TaxID=415217 RepID=UPI00384F0465